MVDISVITFVHLYNNNYYNNVIIIVMKINAMVMIVTINILLLFYFLFLHFLFLISSFPHFLFLISSFPIPCFITTPFFCVYNLSLAGHTPQSDTTYGDYCQVFVSQWNVSCQLTTMLPYSTAASD